MCPDTKKIITLMQVIRVASICVMQNQNGLWWGEQDVVLSLKAIKISYLSFA